MCIRDRNNAARLICRTPKSDHISPVLHTLYWLPVEQRIEYKLLLLAFKSVNDDGPSYLSDLLKFYIPSRRLRSSSDTRLLLIPLFRLKSFGQLKFLLVPLFRLKSFGQRKLSYQASVQWNSLSISLRHSNSTLAFKSAVKTHLFSSQSLLFLTLIDVCVYGGRGEGERESVCVYVSVSVSYTHLTLPTNAEV